MSEINTEVKNEKGGKPKTKKVSTRVDFTPMVDLGFLLITFFMLTTTLIKPQTMEISMPSKDKVKEEEQTKVKASQAMTILIGKENKVYYFFGTQDKGVDPQLVESDYSPEGLRKVLLKKNIDVMLKIQELKEKKNKNLLKEEDYKKQVSDAKAIKTAVIVMIKASDESNYKNLIDVLDEMLICNVARYAIVDITPYDLGLIDKLENKPVVN